MRTIVVSDLHGTPEAFEAILAHAQFDRGHDRLIVAGDFVDGGASSSRCIELAEANDATVLFGNHDVGLMLDEPVMFRAIERQTSGEDLLARALARDWKLATVAEGVIVVHAGFSEEYRSEFGNDAGGDLERFVEQQNARFLAQAQRFAETGRIDGLSIWDDESPVWFRPSWSIPLLGVRQMVGHTSPALYFRSEEEVAELQSRGFYLIDSDAVYFHTPNPLLRYGVIENGEPRVAEFRPG